MEALMVLKFRVVVLVVGSLVLASCASSEMKSPSRNPASGDDLVFEALTQEQTKETCRVATRVEFIQRSEVTLTLSEHVDTSVKKGGMACHIALPEGANKRTYTLNRLSNPQPQTEHTYTSKSVDPRSIGPRTFKSVKFEDRSGSVPQGESKYVIIETDAHGTETTFLSVE
jgi:hypothetical protein